MKKKKGFAPKDHTGERFGHLVVLREAEPYQSAKRIQRRVECQCDCGNITTIYLRQIRKKGVSSSCGCARNKWPSSHGMTKTPTYRIWWGVRCRGLGLYAKENYADKGITVCERWLKFENFLEDMGERPTGRMTIERVDNSKGYSPDNCVWASYSVQARNKCNSRKLILNGEMKCLTDIALENGIDMSTLSYRIKIGMSVEEAITAPIQRRQITYNGETRLLKEWANIFNLDSTTLSQRIDRGWDVGRALNTRPLNRGRRHSSSTSPSTPDDHPLPLDPA